MKGNRIILKWMCIIVVGFIFSNKVALAQLQHNEEPFSICSEDGGQRSVDLVSGADKQFLVVWNDLRNASDPPPPIYFDIYGAFVPHNGGFGICGGFRISNEYRSVGFYNKPCAAYHEAGNEFLVCWIDNDNVYGQRIGGNGQFIGGNFIITPSNQGMVTLTSNSVDGNYLMTYHGGSYLKGLMLDQSGAVIVQPFNIQTGAYHQQAIYNAARNEFLVAYAKSVSGYKIQARRINNLGELLGSEITVAAANGLRYSPTVVYNSKRQEYLIAWYDERNYGQYVSEIWGRRYDGDGVALSDDYLLVGGEWNLLQPAHLAYNSNRGRYLLTWSRQYEFYNYKFEILGYRLNNLGQPIGEIIHFDAGPNLHQNTPRVAFNKSSNRYLIGWEQGGGLFDDGLDIYGQYIRGGPYVKIDKNGPQSTDDDSHIGSSDLFLSQSHPNPLRKTATINYGLPITSNVTLKIRDANGTVVRILLNESKIAGHYSVIWDGRDDIGQEVASGVYFCELKAGNKVNTKKMLVVR